jgi:hypothetical protein
MEIQTLVSVFNAVALLNCSEGAREGIPNLLDRLRNISFVQGLSSDYIQMLGIKTTTFFMKLQKLPS